MYLYPSVPSLFMPSRLHPATLCSSELLRAASNMFCPLSLPCLTCLNTCYYFIWHLLLAIKFQLGCHFLEVVCVLHPSHALPQQDGLLSIKTLGILSYIGNFLQSLHQTLISLRAKTMSATSSLTESLACGTVLAHGWCCVSICQIN